MKNLTRKILTIMATLPHFATAGTIFDVSLLCQKYSTTTGIRYSQPCQEPEIRFVPSKHPSALPEDSLIRKIGYYQRSEVTLTCDSLRPVNLVWNFGTQSGTIGSGQAFKVDLPTNYDGDSWTFMPKLSIDGIQAFKGGCRATQTVNFIYPDIQSIKVIEGVHSRTDRMLSAIFASVTPDSSTTKTIGSVQSAMDLLDLIILGTGDDIVLDVLEQIRTNLQTVESSLSLNCSAGSDAELCTKELATARDLIFDQQASISNDLDEIHSFIFSEIERLKQEKGKTSDIVELMEEILGGI